MHYSIYIYQEINDLKKDDGKSTLHLIFLQHFIINYLPQQITAKSLIFANFKLMRILCQIKENLMFDFLK